MSLELHCEGCGKLLKAPESSGGKRSKCPACGHEVYIPMPPSEIEELPLAPEDETEREREAALQAERRRLDRAIAGERDLPGNDGGSRAGSSSSRRIERETSETADDLEQVMITYLDAMRESDLNRADDALAVLLQNRTAAKRILGRLSANPEPPGELGDIPAAVYRGFLKNLKSQL